MSLYLYCKAEKKNAGLFILGTDLPLPSHYCSEPEFTVPLHENRGGYWEIEGCNIHLTETDSKKKTILATYRTILLFESNDDDIRKFQ